MGYKVDYAALQDICTIYKNSVSSWNKQLESVADKQNVIMKSTNIAGNSANGMKEYMSSVYSTILTSIDQLLQLFKANFLLYIDAYNQNVDGSYEAHIEEEELYDIRNSIDGKKATLGQIALKAEEAVRGIDNLVWLSSLDFGNEDAEIGDIITEIDNLDRAVNELENTHRNADFGEIDELIESIVAFIQEAYSLDINAKQSFTQKTLFSLPSAVALSISAKNAKDYLSNKEVEIKAAEATYKNMMKERQREKREEQAEWVKIGVGIVASLVVFGVGAATGGVGLAVIVTGAVTGFIGGGVSSAADEYVEHGWDEEWDTNRITVDACIGGFTGTIEALIPTEAKTIVKGTVKGITGALETAGENMLDQIETNGKISDVGSVFYDAGVSFASNFTGEIIDDAVSDEIFSDESKKALKDQIKKTGKGTAEYVFRNSESKATSGISKRCAETLIEEAGGFLYELGSGDSLEEAYDEHSFVGEALSDALDPKKIVGDAIKGGVKGGIKANEKTEPATGK